MLLKSFWNWFKPDIATTIEQSVAEGFKTVDMHPVYLADGDMFHIDFKHPETGAHTGSIRLHGTGQGAFVVLVKPA